MLFAVVFAVVTLPLLILGLIDPLEGGLPVLGVVMLGVAVRLLSKVRYPRLAWIALVASVAVGALTVVIAVTAGPSYGTADDVSSSVSIVTMVLVWVYRLGLLVTLAGAVIYIVRLVASLERNRGRSSG